MNKKFKLYFYALLVGTCNAIVCGIFISFYVFWNGAPFVENPYIKYYVILFTVPIFFIQFGITNLILMAILKKLKIKINPYLIVFIGTLLFSYGIPSLVFKLPIITLDTFKTGEFHFPIYLGIATIINFIGFHLLIRKKTSQNQEEKSKDSKFDVYFYSLIIGTINGVLCGIIIPLYHLRSEIFLSLDWDTSSTLMSFIFIFTFISLIQFSLTSGIITFLILIIKPKRIVISYLIVSIVTITSLFIGRGIFIVPHTLRNGEYLGLIYFMITLVVYFFGYRWLLNKFSLNIHESQNLPEEESLTEK